MSELQTMQDALDIVKDIQIGDLVQGEVLTLQDKQAIVGIIGGGVEGVIPFNELSTSPVERVEDGLSVGDVVDLVVIKQIKDKENGSFLLSKKRVDARKVWEEIQAKFDNKEIITAPVKEAVKGGVKIVQLREKNISTKDFYEKALKVKEICKNYGVLFIINDRLDIAQAVGADGVHLGQSDMPIEKTREILKDKFLIGATARNVEEAKRAEEEAKKAEKEAKKAEEQAKKEQEEDIMNFLKRKLK